MQKKIIALAIAGLASSAAFAQSNVTIYGRADYGYISRGGDSGAMPNSIDSRNEFASGIGAGSRIGFKGSEDLGNGLKAIFEIEYGTAIDSQATSGTGASAYWWNRHSYVGLTSDKYGTLVGGKLDGVRYGIFNKYDAFAGGYMGNFTQMTSQVDRADNAIAYISPKFGGGFDLTLAYSTAIGTNNGLANTGNGQEGANATLGNGATAVNGNDGDAWLKTIRLAYGNGPISVDLDWEQVSYKGGKVANANALAINDVTVYTIAGSYDFGMVKVAALYDNLKIDGRHGFRKLGDVDSWMLSASVPYGNFLFKGTYGDTDNSDTKNASATKWGLGAQYNLSKRTNMYIDYGSINNDKASAIRISPAANAYGATSAYGTHGWDIGMAHNF